MTIIVPNFNTEKTYIGLNTYQYTIVTAGVHICKIEVDKFSTSNLTVSIVQAGSVNATLATTTVQPRSIPDSATESKVILQALANCAVNDTISFVLTSSASTDQQLNTVKSTLRVNLGQTN